MNGRKCNNEIQNSEYFKEKFKGDIIDLREIQLSYKYEGLIDAYMRTFPKSKNSKINKRENISSMDYFGELHTEIENNEEISSHKQIIENFEDEIAIQGQKVTNSKKMNLSNDKADNSKNYHLKNLFIEEEKSFKQDLNINLTKKNFDKMEDENDISFLQYNDCNYEDFESFDELPDRNDSTDIKEGKKAVLKFGDNVKLKEKNYYTKYYSLSDLRILWKCSEIVLIAKLNEPTIDKQGRLEISMKEKPIIIKGNDSFENNMNSLIWSKGGKKDFHQLVNILDTILIFCKVSQEEFPFYLNVLGFDILNKCLHSELENLISGYS